MVVRPRRVYQDALNRTVLTPNVRKRSRACFNSCFIHVHTFKTVCLSVLIFEHPRRGREENSEDLVGIRQVLSQVFYTVTYYVVLNFALVDKVVSDKRVNQCLHTVKHYDVLNSAL